MNLSPSRKNRIKTVSKPLELMPLGLAAERKQTPHVVERTKERMGSKEGLDDEPAPFKHRVAGSNPARLTS